jgi:hypothetical protein
MHIDPGLGESLYRAARFPPAPPGDHASGQKREAVEKPTLLTHPICCQKHDGQGTIRKGFGFREKVRLKWKVTEEMLGSG